MMQSRYLKIGGISALVASATVIIGLGLFATLLTDYTTGDPTTAESVAFVADNYGTMYVWNTITLVGFAVVLVPVALALYTRLRERTPVLAQVSAAFGVIWSALLFAGGMITNIGLGSISDLASTDAAQAESVWLTLDAVQSGLSGGNEIVGGIWILLVSLAALQAHEFPRAMNYLGIVMALSALATIVPAAEMVAIVFGLGLIVWFAWLGIVMLGTKVDSPSIFATPKDFASTSAPPS